MGEIWYAEGDTPTGPWVFAKKVVSHNQYFYNPVHHPYFDQKEGKTIYFEGTYTNIFNANPVIKPRYEYNQLMYRLSLEDPRLFLPVPVYQIKSGYNKIRYQLKESVDSNNSWQNISAVDFFAFPPGRAYENLIPIYLSSNELNSILSTTPKGELLFYALPIEGPKHEKFLGTWVCKMTDGVFINREFKLKLQNKDKQLLATIGDAGYSVLNVMASENSLDFNVNYVDKSYYFQGEVNSGKIKGSWTSSDSTSTGSWESENIDYLWQPVHSPLLVPLYVYTSKNSSDWFYSIDHGSEFKSYIRSDVAICRVWKNPVTNIKIEPAINVD